MTFTIEYNSLGTSFMSHYTALSSEKWKVTWAVENKTNFKRQIHMYGWIYFSKVCTDFKKSTYIHRSYCRFAMLNAHHKRKIKTHGCQQFSCLSFSHRSPFTNTHVMLSKFLTVEFHLFMLFTCYWVFYEDRQNEIVIKMW